MFTQLMYVTLNLLLQYLVERGGGYIRNLFAAGGRNGLSELCAPNITIFKNSLNIVQKD